MTLPTNLVKIGGGGPSVREFLVSGQLSERTVTPLHTKTKYITTHAVRVGGGYELRSVEKPVLEDKAQIRFLRHMIGLKQAAKRELLHRIDTMMNANLQLAQANELGDAKSYHDSLLAHQRELAKMQELQSEREQIEVELSQKREQISELRATTSDTVLKLSESIERVREKVSAEERRTFELKNFHERSRPLLAIREQQLHDELARATKENVKRVVEISELNNTRHARDKADHDGRVQKILDRSVERVLGSYSNRFVQELYLNNQMKFEIDYCRTELETLRHEIEAVKGKIDRLPKHSFNERDAEKDATEVNQIFKFEDYPPIDPPPRPETPLSKPQTPRTASSTSSVRRTPTRKKRLKKVASAVRVVSNHSHVKIADEIQHASEPTIYTFNIERKLHLPI